LRDQSITIKYKFSLFINVHAKQVGRTPAQQVVEAKLASLHVVKFLATYYFVIAFWQASHTLAGVAGISM
jgi:hypothetical protein